MIYVQVSGGCGNQLFRYATAKTLSKMHHDNKIVMNFWLVEASEYKGGEFVDDLKDFQMDDYKKVCEDGSPIKKYGSRKQKIVWGIYRVFVDNKLTKTIFRDKHILGAWYYKFQSKLQRVLNRFGIYNLIQGDEPLRKTKEKNKFIIGNYENKIYFDRYKALLKNNIKLRELNFTEYNKNLLKHILENESVCVQVRRRGFLKENCGDDLKDICHEKYYLKAIKLMKKMHPDAVFVFFSDDIEWVRDNFDFGVPCLYESGTDKPATVLYLMSNCKNFIMPNSTLSWWAQYLSENGNKIVISPDRWFNLKGFEHPLIDDDWIILKA